MLDTTRALTTAIRVVLAEETTLICLSTRSIDDSEVFRMSVEENMVYFKVLKKLKGSSDTSDAELCVLYPLLHFQALLSDIMVKSLQPRDKLRYSYLVKYRDKFEGKGKDRLRKVIGRQPGDSDAF